MIRVNHSKQQLDTFYILCDKVFQQVDKTIYIGISTSDYLSWNSNIRIRIIRIKLYFILVLKTINISFKLSVTSGNKQTI